MYNRYIPNGTSYTRVPMDEKEQQPPREHRQDSPSAPRQPSQGPRDPRPEGPRPQGRPSQSTGIFSLPGFLAGKGQGELGSLSGLLKSLKVDDLDSGDILLFLIVLFLLLEGDNLELVIALGVVLLMGLTDDEKKKEGQP